MVAKAVIEQRCRDYYWAAIKVARQTWRMYGQRTTIACDEAEAEGLLALTEAAASKNYDPRRGTFGGFAKMAVLRAVRRHCLKAQRYTPVADVREEDAPREEDSALVLRMWASRNPEQAGRLFEYTDGEAVSPEAVSALSAVRKETGISGYALRAHTTQTAARMLGINERRVRALAESGDLTGRRVGGQWQILVSSCAAYRERRVIAELKRRPTIAAVARATHTSKQHAYEIAKRHGAQIRTRGRPESVDIQLVLSLLTDNTQNAAFWRRGKPRIDLIAKAAGCSPRHIYRLAKV